MKPCAVILGEAKKPCCSRRTGRSKAVRWVTVPQSSSPGAPTVQGVALASNEDVQWFWTHTSNGSYISGYNIVRRPAPLSVILSEAKNLGRSGRVNKRQRRFAALRVTKSNC